MKFQIFASHNKIIKIMSPTLILLLATITIIQAWDYFIFAQVWPASWIHHDKIKYNFTNDYFTVHGLWPTYDNGSWPQYCDNVTFNATYLEPIYKKLDRYWTNFRDPESFWEHEFLKHMTCAEDTYYPYLLFDYGLEWRSILNMYQVLYDHGVSPGDNYDINKLYDIIKANFGSNVVITCDRDSILTEIHICMTKLVRPFDCPENEYKEECKSDMIFYNAVI